MNKELIVGGIYFYILLLEMLARTMIFLAVTHYLIFILGIIPAFSQITLTLIGTAYIIKPFIDFITREEFKLKCN